MGSTQSRCTVFIHLIVAFALLVLAAPTRAAVGEVVLQPCAQGATYGYGVLSAYVGAQWGYETGCPSYLNLFTTAGDPLTAGARLSYPNVSVNRGNFKKVSFDLLGGDGSDGGRYQGVTVCVNNTSTCGPRVSPSGPDVTLAEHHDLTVESGEIPNGGDRFSIVGGCAALETIPCSAGRAMQVKNLKITILDTEKPTLQPGLVPSGSGLSTVEPYTWQGGNREFRVHATDAKTGVKFVQYSILTPDRLGGARWYEAPDSCGPGRSNAAAIPYLCPQQFESVHTHNFDEPMNTFAISDGLNHVEIVAYDAAGNRSDPFEYDIMIDHISPVISDLVAIPERTSEWRSDQQVGLRWRNDGEFGESETESGLVRADYTVTPVDGAPGSGYSSFVEGPVDEIRDLGIPGPGRWHVTLTVTDGVGHVSNPLDVNVSIDQEIAAAPPINPLPLMAVDDLLRGRNVTWEPPANTDRIRSGICGYAMTVDQSPSTDPGTIVAISGDATAAELPKWLPDGVSYVHLRAISCAGVPGEIASAELPIDAQPPEIDVTEPGPGGWYSQAHPLGISLPRARDAGSQIGVSVDGRPDVWASVAELPVDLRDGEHTISIKAKDPAGNTSTMVKSVGSDSTSPQAVFTDVESARPTLVRAIVSDATSGLVDARLEYRAQGADAWQELGTPWRPAASGERQTVISANIPDAELPDGLYELRVFATDLAGNEFLGGSRVDLSPAVLRLPLRAKPTLTAEFVTTLRSEKCSIRKTRRRCRVLKRVVRGDHASVAYGKTASFTGRLIDHEGSPITGAALSVIASSIGSSPRDVSTVQTDSEGRFDYRLAAGTSRLIEIRYAGSEVNASVDNSDHPLKLFVSAGVRLSVSRTGVAGRPYLRFAGRILARGAAWPRAGKPVQIQYKTDGGWRLLPAEVTAAADGRFGFDWPVSRAGRRIEITFRARVLAADGWPYATGVSRTLARTLR